MSELTDIRPDFSSLNDYLICSTSYTWGLGSAPLVLLPIWAPWWVGVSGTNFLKNMDAAEHSKTNKDTAIAKEGKQRTLILTTVMVFLHTLIFENL